MRPLPDGSCEITIDDRKVKIPPPEPDEPPERENPRPPIGIKMMRGEDVLEFIDPAEPDVRDRVADIIESHGSVSGIDISIRLPD